MTDTCARAGAATLTTSRKVSNTFLILLRD